MNRLLLCTILFFHIVTNIIWLKVDNAPPSWDAANHTLISFKIADNLKDFNLPGILESSEYYPIFVHTLGALTALLTGPNIEILQFIGTIFFVIAIVSLYFYTKLLYNDKRLAFFSAALFSFFPIVFAESRRFMLDLPLTAVLIICLYLLEKSENLTKRNTSILFFAALGLLLMTKWTGAVFIAIPLVISLIKTISSHNLGTTFKNILLGLPIFLLVVIPWYFTNFQSFYSLSQINVEAYADQPENLLSLENFAYYIRLFVNYQVTPILALIFFASSAFLFYKKMNGRWMLISVSAAYLFFTFLSNKDPRYLMPLLPFVAIIISLGLAELERKYKYAISITIGFLLIYFLVLTIRPVSLENFRLSIRLPFFDWINIVDVTDPLVKKYNTGNWNIDSLLGDLAKNKRTRAIVSVEDEYINPTTLSLYLYHHKKRSQIELASPDISYLLKTYSKPLFPSEEAVVKYIRSADFLLISPLNLGTDYLRNKEALTQIQHYFIGDSLLPCSEFETKVAPRNTTCYVRMGEILETISDIRINDSPDDKVGLKTLSNFTKIRCPYACSFRQIKAPPKRFDIDLVNEYKFPNGLRLQLYKV